jgi:hypothetical protein
VKGRKHRGLRDRGDHAVFQRHGGGKPKRLVVQATLAEELPGLENADDSLLAVLGQHDNFDAAVLNVEDLVGRISLREHGLVLVESQNGISLADLREEGLRVELLPCGLCQRSSPE